MSVYKLYGQSSGGTENSLASLDIQFEGVIVAIHASVYGNLDADSEFISAEASFLSTNTFGVNDSRGSLIIVGSQMSLTTSGVAVQGVNSGLSGLNIAVNAGERVHLHFSSTAGVVATAQIYMYVNDGSDPLQRRRR